MANDTPVPCTICSKPRTNHRGKMDHEYTTLVPRAALQSMRDVATRPFEPAPGRPRQVARRTQTAKRGAQTRRIMRKAAAPNDEDKVSNVITLASRIKDLQQELDSAMAELKEMLA